MGLPGAGKTTLANALSPVLNAVVFNADAVRANLSRDLGFSPVDRIEHARRMGWMCDRVVEAGGTVIADFICPTMDTRAVFGDAFTIWVDRIKRGRFEDTNRILSHQSTRTCESTQLVRRNIGLKKPWHFCGPHSTRRNRLHYSSGVTSRFTRGTGGLSKKDSGESAKSVLRFVTLTELMKEIPCHFLR